MVHRHPDHATVHAPSSAWASLLVTAGAAIAAFACAAGFMLVVAASVMAHGPCCADDAWFATVAKNLATGVGYASTLQLSGSTYGVHPFDGGIGTGPTLIFPAAALIRVFGNAPWTPGLAAVLLWCSPLAATAVLLRRAATPRRLLALGTAFIIVVYALTPFNFEHWYALLGEIPAGCMIVLALAVWAIAPGTPRAWILSGALLGFAILAKALAVLWAVWLLLFVAVRPLPHATAHERSRAMALCALGAVVPVLVFELWKLWSLGPVAYRQEIAVTWSYAAQLGASGQSGSMASRLGAFTDAFAVPLIMLSVAATAAWAFTLHFGSARLGGLASLLFGGIVVHVIWWAAFSVGWPRYMVLAFVPLALLLALPLAAAPTRDWFAAASLLLVFLLVPAWARMGYPLATLPDRWFQPSPASRQTQQVARYLETHAGHSPVFTQWWAMVASVEYVSRAPLTFQPIARMEHGARPAADYLVVSDDRWLNAGDALFLATIRDCGAPALAAGPYRVFRCAPISLNGSRP